MNDVLSYEAINLQPKPAVWVYPVVVSLNCLGLIAAAIIFKVEISGDIYAPLIGLVVGAPLWAANCWLVAFRRGFTFHDMGTA